MYVVNQLIFNMGLGALITPRTNTEISYKRLQEGGSGLQAAQLVTNVLYKYKSLEIIILR